MFDKFHSGGTVTGRWPRDPEMQDLPRLGRKPVASVMVMADFAEIEKRVLADLENKTGIADAMRKALADRTKGGKL